jgi:hypothetical protein
LGLPLKRNKNCTVAIRIKPARCAFVNITAEHIELEHSPSRRESVTLEFNGRACIAVGLFREETLGRELAFQVSSEERRCGARKMSKIWFNLS